MVETGGAFNVNFRAVKSLEKEEEELEEGRQRAIKLVKKSGRISLFPLEIVEQEGSYAAVRLGHSRSFAQPGSRGDR